MTTKQSSINPFLHTFKANLKGIALFPAIINFAIITFFTVFLSGIPLLSANSIVGVDGNITQTVSARNQYFASFFRDTEYSLTPALVLIALASLAVAISTFYFITSKKTVNVYFSLGISRKSLFLSKYLSGALLLAVSVFVPLFLTLIINLITLGFNFYIFKSFFIFLFSFLFVSFAAYSIGAAIFTCVGTVFEAGIFSGILLFLPDIIFFSIEYLMSKFLYGNPYGFSFVQANSFYYDNSDVQTLSQKLSFLSPVFFPIEQLKNYGLIKKETVNGDVNLPDIPAPDYLFVLIWVLLTVLFIVLGIKLFERRKAEIAGFIGTNRLLNTLTSFTAAFFAFAFAVTNIENLVPALIVAIVAFSLVHLILEIIVLRDIKKFVKGLYKLPIGLVASTAVVLILNAGFFGFSNQIPELNNIKGASITIAGSTSEAGLFGDEYYMGDSNLRYLKYNAALMGDMTSEHDIKAVLDVHRKITETDSEDRTLENSIQISYTLKNGKTFKRNFKGVSPENLKALLYLEDTDYYKNALYDLFKSDFKEITDKTPLSTTENIIYKAKYSLKNPYSQIKIYGKFQNTLCNLIPTEKDRARLLNAIYTDLSSRSVTEKYYPDSSPIAFISFEGDPGATIHTENGIIYEPSKETTEPTIEKIKKTTFEFSDFASNNGDVYFASKWTCHPFIVVTPDMTETIKLLKEFKIYDSLVKAPQFVSAEVFPADTVFEAGFSSQSYMKTDLSRYFMTTYTNKAPSNTNDGYYIYYNIIEDKLQGLVISEEKEINTLLKYARTAYVQDSTDSGYFAVFYTENDATSLCYIPENELPQGIKNNVFATPTETY